MLKVIYFIIGIPVIIVFLIYIFSILGNIFFRKRVNQEITRLFNTGITKKEIIKKSDLAGLPDCVQKWLQNSNVLGKEKINTVRLKQKGFMRMQEGQKWLPFTAEQYFSIKEPGFIWTVNVKAAPFISLTGRDKYYKNQGSMLIKLCSLLNVVNVNGDRKELIQGAMLRFLAEMMWFPQAAISNYLEWKCLDENSAVVTMTNSGLRVSAVFRFNTDGNIIKIKARRYKEEHGEYVLADWGGITESYRTFNDVLIPDKGTVVWDLDNDNFEWFKFEITDIEYNIPQAY